ncbi:MAG: hypothetical protein K9L31_02445 [Candidatus Pacebacteria bacterium]|nr:hypothetical protein [Candidatus Paceibacterota bacterium]
MSPTIFLAVLFATLITDALWALYMIKVTAKAPFLAATYGSLIHILTAFTVISYTKNYLYLIPLVIGSFVGTYLTVKFAK